MSDLALQKGKTLLASAEGTAKREVAASPLRGALLARIGKVELRSVGGCLAWRSGLAVDADGSPRAYHPDSRRGLDALANAGKPGNWWGLACDQRGLPYVQGAGDPAPGFYVSTTALFDPRHPERSCARYVDAETVPYIVLPPGLPGGARLGDLAMVVRAETGAHCAAIWADVGPRGKLGEGSIALARALGINPDPRRGGCASGIVYLLFPGSGNRRPQSATMIAQRGEELFARHSLSEDRLVV